MNRVYDLSGRDRVRVEGPDAPAFLNRLLTVDCARMPVGGGSRAFLLNATGRVELCLHLLRVSDEAFLAECSAGHGEEVLGKLDLYHFGERLTFGPAAGGLLSVHGPGAADTLLGAGLPVPPAPYQHVEAAVGGQQIRVARVDRESGPGYDLWCADAAALRSRLVATPGDPGELERRRVLAGVPDHPAEYGPHSTPLEVGGTAGITEGKGCYPGQEVVERTIALGRPARALVRLVLSGEAHPEDTVCLDDEAIGALTSVARDDAGTFHALALVKRKHAEHEGPLTCGATEARISR